MNFYLLKSFIFFFQIYLQSESNLHIGVMMLNATSLKMTQTDANSGI